MLASLWAAWTQLAGLPAWAVYLREAALAPGTLVFGGKPSLAALSATLLPFYLFAYLACLKERD